MAKRPNPSSKKKNRNIQAQAAFAEKMLRDTAGTLRAQQEQIRRQRAAIQDLLDAASKPAGISPDVAATLLTKSYDAGRQSAFRADHPFLPPLPGASTPGYNLARESAIQAVAAREPDPRTHFDPRQRPDAAPGRGGGLPASSTRLLAPAGTPERRPGPFGPSPNSY